MDIRSIIDKAIKDPAYAETLKTNPADALKQIGVEPTADKTAALSEAIQGLIRAHVTLSGARPD